MRARIKEGWYPYGVGLIVELAYVKVYGKISENIFEVIKVIEGQRKHYDLCVRKLMGKTIGINDLDFNYDKNMRDTTKTFRVKIKDNHPNPSMRGLLIRVSLDEKLDYGDRYKIELVENCGSNHYENYFIMDEYLHFELTPNDEVDFYLEKQRNLDETDYLLSSKANREALEKSIEEADKGNVRRFESGAVRAKDDDKEDYIESISWLTMQAYAKYMKGHEKTYGRGNWKKGIPIEEYEKSLMRHIQKYLANKYHNANLEPEVNHLLAAFFNLQGLIHEEEKLKNQK